MGDMNDNPIKEFDFFILEYDRPIVKASVVESSSKYILKIQFVGQIEKVVISEKGSMKLIDILTTAVPSEAAGPVSSLVASKASKAMV